MLVPAELSYMRRIATVNQVSAALARLLEKTRVHLHGIIMWCTENEVGRCNLLAKTPQGAQQLRMISPYRNGKCYH